MKKKILLMATLFVSINLLAQNPINLYDFAFIPQSSLNNPSYDTYKEWHLSVPLINVETAGAASGIVLHDIYAANDIPFGDKVKTAVYNMSKNDIFLFNQKVDVINIGMKLKNDYYLSLGFYEELDVYSNFPRDMAELFYEGTSQINKQYSIDGYNLTADLLGVYHVGINKRLRYEENIGARLKLYSGVYNAYSNNNKGLISTIEGQDNFYRHIISEFDAQINTSGIEKIDFENLLYTETIKRMLFSGNKGVGLDIGYSRQLNYEWYISASLLDVGLMYNSKDVTNYNLKGSYVTEGIELNYYSVDPIDYWQALKDDFEQKIEANKTHDSYISWRPLKLNAFAKYSFGDNSDFECNYYGETNRSRNLKNSVGGLLHIEKRNRQILPFGSLFYERNFNDKALFRLSYSADKFNYTDVGLAIGLNLWHINFYAGANNLMGLFDVAKAHSVSAQFGLNIALKDNNY